MGDVDKVVKVSVGLLNKNEVLKYIKHQIKRPMIFFDTILFGIVFCFTFVLFYLALENDVIIAILASASLSMFWTLAMGFTNWIYRLNYRIYNFGNEGMSLLLNKKIQNVTWENFISIYETNEMLEIIHRNSTGLINTIQLSIIPKRCVVNNSEVENLKQLFYSNIDKSRLKLLV